MVNIAVFASGNGSNAVNLVKTFNTGNRIRVALCLTDKEDAPVMEKMTELGVETVFYPRSVWKEEPQVIIDQLSAHDVKIIVLAGFLCYVNPEIVKTYEGRILNVHPSLLPAYGGKGMHGSKVHQAVVEAGETKSGATVHVVTENLDEGPIVVQKEVAVLPDDTPETLEAKVHEVEYEILPLAVMKTAKGFEPPAPPKSVDDEWAEKLGVPNNVPPIPKAVGGNAQPIDKAQSTMRNVQYQPPVNPWMQQPRTMDNGHQAMQPPMPKSYLLWAVLSTALCCMIPGIVAIFYSAKVSSKYYAGDYAGAERASHNAEIWIIVSFVLGVLSNTLYLPLLIAGGF